MNRVFDARRLYLLARKDAFEAWRGCLVAIAAIIGVLIVLAFLGVLVEGERTMDYEAYFLGAMFVWGSIAASRAFGELHDKNRNEAFLLLPASALEKTLVRLLTVSLVLPILILIVVLAGSVLSETLTSLVFGLAFEPFNPLSGAVWRGIGCAVIVQSIFFLGGAWFRKAHFIKTVLAVIVLGISLGILGGVFFRIVYAPYFNGITGPQDFDFCITRLPDTRLPAVIHVFGSIGRIMLYGITAPFCWFTAWLRIRETQSSYGI